ncbi:ABC transporter permease [Streptomyces subrutilus]|uniref:ABC transporter permease n=1 Tax=Streptomyces subrutilus TaxID=36818 RepID=UPI00340BB88A
MSTDMSRHVMLFRTATRFALVEHARNRFAMLLVVLFVPAWITVVHLVVATAPIGFRLKATGIVLRPGADQLMQVTGALNAITMIAGFLMFASTFTAGPFDRRLNMAGYPLRHLVLAKLTTLVVASAALAVYATALLACFWVPQRPLVLVAAMFCDTLTYGAFGVALGALLRREVEGMFVIAMISTTDLILQNPVYSAGADSSFLRLLPSYGAVQASTAAAFSGAALPAYLALQLAWFVAAALIDLLAFRRGASLVSGR